MCLRISKEEEDESHKVHMLMHRTLGIILQEQ